jgi:hypothetical protein
MWSVHPNAFQNALTPIPRDGVVRIGVVPNDRRRAAIKSGDECDPEGEKKGLCVHKSFGWAASQTEIALSADNFWAI